MSGIKIGPAFFDSISGERKSKSRGSNSFLTPDSIILAPLFFLLLFFGIIVARLFYLQILQNSYYKGLSDQNRTRTTTIAAPRGIILDRFGRPLVANSPSYKIINGKEVTLLTNDQGLKLMANGKNVESDVVRDYLYKNAFAHVLGYVGQISENESILPEFSNYALTDFVGKIGLEKQYEKILHGTNGREIYEVNSNGVKLRDLGTDAPIPGANLNTTLDRDIGVSVEKAVDAAKIAHGAVVVSNPADGGILAMYSAPSFDPNLFTHSKGYQASGNYHDVSSILLDGAGQPLLDRAMGGSYPPGSTFKLVSATAALENGAITPTTEIEDTGILKVGDFSFGNWYFLQYGRKEGSLNVVGAIKRSNDIFFYKAAEKTGVDKVSAWARKFGLGSKTGIDLPAEASGTVPTVEWKEKTIGEQWYLGDTYNYGIGQGYLLTTPLQVNMFTDVFASQGKLFKPHLILGDNKIVRQNFIGKQNIDLVREGMAEACDTGGVAWPLFNFKVKNSHLKIDNINYFPVASASADYVHVKLACKTGTAEIGGADTKPHAWITVFAPFVNPEIAVTVLVENGGEGSSIAGPIAKQILTDYFTKKNN